MSIAALCRTINSPQAETHDGPRTFDPRLTKMASLKYLTISIGDVYQRVGVIERAHVSRNDLQPRPAFNAKQYGIIVYWPRTLAWLELRLRHGEQGGEFKDDRDGLVAVCQQVGAD